MLTSFVPKYLCFAIRYSVGRGAGGRCLSQFTAPCKVRDFTEKGTLFPEPFTFMVFTDNIKEPCFCYMRPIHGKTSVDSRITTSRNSNDIRQKIINQIQCSTIMSHQIDFSQKFKLLRIVRASFQHSSFAVHVYSNLCLSINVIRAFL